MLKDLGSVRLSNKCKIKNIHSSPFLKVPQVLHFFHWLSGFTWNCVALQKFGRLWYALQHGSFSFCRGSQTLWAPLHVHLSNALKISILSATKRNVRKCVCRPQTPSLQPNPLFLLHSSDQFIFKTQIHIFFIPGITHTHTHRRWFSFTGRHMLTSEPHTSASLALSSSQSKSVKASPSVCLSDGPRSVPLPWAGSQRWERRFPRALSGSILHRT